MFCTTFVSGEWSSPSVTGTKPPPLVWFSFTKIDHRRAVVYGGWDGEKALGDAYVLELDKLVCQWLEICIICSHCSRKLSCLIVSDML